MTTLTYTNNSNQTITISHEGLDQLYWSDEYKWSKVIQSQEYAISGSLIVEDWVKLSGRPITLQGGDDRTWVSKEVVIQIQTLLDLPGQSITLYLTDGRQFTVIFDNSSGAGFEAEPLGSIYPTPPEIPYVIKSMKFITT